MRKTHGETKKGHYHHPPFPTTPANCRRRFASHHTKNYYLHIQSKGQLAPIDKYSNVGRRKK